MAVVAAEHMAPWCPQNKNMYGIVEVGFENAKSMQSIRRRQRNGGASEAGDARCQMYRHATYTCIA